MFLSDHSKIPKKNLLAKLDRTEECIAPPGRSGHVDALARESVTLVFRDEAGGEYSTPVAKENQPDIGTKHMLSINTDNNSILSFSLVDG